MELRLFDFGLGQRQGSPRTGLADWESNSQCAGGQKCLMHTVNRKKWYVEEPEPPGWPAFVDSYSGWAGEAVRVCSDAGAAS